MPPKADIVLTNLGVLDLMRSASARLSQALALTSFVDDGYDFGVILTSISRVGNTDGKRSIELA